MNDNPNNKILILIINFDLVGRCNVIEKFIR